VKAQAKEIARQNLARLSTMNGREGYVLLVAAIALAILARFNESLPGDVSMIKWMQNRHRPAITSFMEAVSLIGRSPPLVGLVSATALAMFLVQRQRGRRLVNYRTAVGVLVIMFFNPIIQIFVNRSRPPADLVSEPLGGQSFPSGHAYEAVVVFGFFIYLAATFIRRTRLRRFIQMVLAFLILAMGISRIYLGAHWPSDVLGSFLFAGSFLVIWLRR
jgi:undecaprenyl-diphosphatase